MFVRFRVRSENYGTLRMEAVKIRRGGFYLPIGAFLQSMIANSVLSIVLTH